LGREVTAQRFKPGDRVRVRSEDKPGHVRTPGYVRGKAGRVESMLGEFRNPESLAYGDPGLPERPLYKVSFRQEDLWEEYPGSPGDTLCMDIYEHWLEPAREEAP
jgi:hypothetical protein